MEPIFTDKQLNNMSREDLISLMKIVQEQTKKTDTEIQLLKEKQKELEFLNAMLSDRLTLAQRKQFGASSEKYAEGYEQMNLFNEAEASADAETEELFEEIRPSSYKRKKRKGKKEEGQSQNHRIRRGKFTGSDLCPARRADFTIRRRGRRTISMDRADSDGAELSIRIENAF